MNVKYFANPTEFRNWLIANHESENELWVGYYKKHTKIPSITWPESVDEALCFGWIDGLRKSIDDKSYKIRFTPRRRYSNWSAVNIRRVKELIKLDLMEPAGLKAFKNIKKYQIDSNGQENSELRKAYEHKLKNNPQAWTFFQSLAPSHQRTSIGWVVSAKKEETRQKRLDVLIESSLKREKIPGLQISKKK